MSETTMPAAEAAVATNDEIVSYELAFHVLPTVAEGEVDTVVSTITKLITSAGGNLGLSEKPQRFDLAYELTKMIDGKYRRFTTAYFGWIRFTAEPAAVTALAHEVEAQPEILRVLLLRLTRQEEEHPFFIHEAMAARKQVTDIDIEAERAAPAAVAETADDMDADTAAADDEKETDDTKVPTVAADTTNEAAAEDAATTDEAETDDKS